MSCAVGNCCSQPDGTVKGERREAGLRRVAPRGTHITGHLCEWQDVLLLLLLLLLLCPSRSVGPTRMG